MEFELKYSDGNRDRNTISLMILSPNKSFNGRYFTHIDVDQNCSVQVLRNVISCMLRINLYSLDVCFLGDTFIGGTLNEFGVTDNDVLVLKSRKNVRKEGELFIIQLENQSVNISQILLDDFQTVAGLKSILRAQYDVNIKRIHLLVDGEELIDECVVRELDIATGTVFQVVVSPQDENCEGKMRIGVRFEAEEVGHVDVSGQDTVDMLRTLVQTMLCLPDNKFVISNRGVIMKNDTLLSTYDIKDGDIVLVSHSLLVRYFLSADNNASKVNRYAFLPTDSVLDLKLKIKSAQNIETRFLRLAFNGAILEDDMILGELGVENESHLMLVTTLAGGVFVNCPTLSSAEGGHFFMSSHSSYIMT